MDQVGRDNNIRGLLEEITDIYSLVTRYGSLDDLDDARRKILQDLALQTVDCAYFVRDQAEVRNFCKGCI